MCGIAGILYPQPAIHQDDFAALLRSMGNAIAHRGPDDSGVWLDAGAGVGLAHRRLAIIDLSPAGHQPMTSANGRYVMVFNGEIYNYRPIRAALASQGVGFKGHSDTETLLESIAMRGLDNTLAVLNGMFAFALWDKQTRTLILARDRIGKKPLYYGFCNRVLLFGSELKALRKHPAFDHEIDRHALSQFIQYAWLNGPASIYRHIKKLTQGTYIAIKAGAGVQSCRPVVYWSALDKAQQGALHPLTCTYDEAVDKLDQLLQAAVRRRMIADVEPGALLSGGIDSSLVVSLMQRQSARPVKTFSIGFHEQAYNEAGHAGKIARYLATDHAELYVTPKQCRDVIPLLPRMYDEPFADVSQIPTYLVSRLAREKVKVVLSGDGGDELFAGYTRYFRCVQHWKKHQRVPLLLRPALGGAMGAIAGLCWRLSGRAESGAQIAGWRRFGAKLEKRARRIDAGTCLQLFMRMMARYKNIHQLVIGGAEAGTMLTDRRRWPDHDNAMLNMMLIDTLCYLPDDILVKVDRASMAGSLEARCPLLDKDLVEFSWQIPMHMKADDGSGKKILKSVLAKYIPGELTERKKMGFGVPVGQWLRGPLKAWAEDLLDVNVLQRQAYLHAPAVQTLWRQHQSGWRNHSDLLWSILMFQAWLAEQAPNESK